MKKNKGQKADKRLPISALKYIFILVILVAVIPIILFNTDIIAKYMHGEENNVLLPAESFYFESDMLTVSTGTIPQYTLKAGVDTISFSLMNYPDELRSSEVDITYNVDLTIDGKKDKSASGDIKSGRNSVSISFDNLNPGTYTVTATATKPYTKTLQARFTIVSTDYELSYSVSDAPNSPYLKVTVTTTDYSGDIVISWPEGVLPDNTDPLLKNADGQSCVISVKAQSEYTFQFFKTNPSNNYSNDIYVDKKS